MSEASEKEEYLRLGGWMQGNNGWWHPPSCLASWPINEAYDMAKKDEERGMRMDRAELREYLRDIGMTDIDEYLSAVSTQGLPR